MYQFVFQMSFVFYRHFWFIAKLRERWWSLNPVILYVHSLSHYVFVTAGKSTLTYTSSPPEVHVCVRCILGWMFCGFEQMHPNVSLLLWHCIYIILKCVSPYSTGSLAMAQVEKRGGLLRKSSASKKPLKEKVVLMYDEIFMVRLELPLSCTARVVFLFLKKNKVVFIISMCVHICLFEQVQKNTSRGTCMESENNLEQTSHYLGSEAELRLSGLGLLLRVIWLVLCV